MEWQRCVCVSVCLSICLKYWALCHWKHLAESGWWIIQHQGCGKRNSQGTCGPFQHWDSTSLWFIHLSLIPFLLYSFIFPPSDAQSGGEKVHSSVSKLGTVVSSFFPHPLLTPCCVQKMRKMFPQAQGSVTALCDICNMGTMMLVPHGTWARMNMRSKGNILNPAHQNSS